MIRYSLRCNVGHGFDGWFRDAAGFENQRDRGLLSCTECGSPRVDRALMAPPVRSSRARRSEAPRPAPTAPSLEVSPAEKALAELRRRVETHSTYVGRDFARQARAMHDGTAEHRTIHGEAAPAEARALIEDGVPIAPLPFASRDKAN